MAAPILELKAKRNAFAKEANDRLKAVSDKAIAEGRKLTDEEKASLDADDQKLAAFDEQIGLEQKRIDREKTITPIADKGNPSPRITRQHNRADDDKARGFRNPRDFLVAVMEAGQSNGDEVDERLKPVMLQDKEGPFAMLPEAFTPSTLRAAAGSDEQGGYDDRYGGFSVGSVVLPGMLSVGSDADPTVGRTTSIPMAAPSVKILARTDKNHTTSVSGGLTVGRSLETVSKTASRMEMERITLEASSVFGLAYATEEILQDSAISFAAVLAAGFDSEFAANQLKEKIRGSGGNEYLGILSSPAEVEVAAEGGQSADTISGTNIVKMRARAWRYSDAIWIANHDTLPQLVLAHITGTNGDVFLFAPGNGVDKPDTLLGRPIFFNEFASTLGDVGDLILCNWSQYLEGLYQPLQSAESVHVRFTNHERAFKFWLRNAGAPWWRSAITPNKGSDTLSPIVTLAAR